MEDPHVSGPASITTSLPPPSTPQLTARTTYASPRAPSSPARPRWPSPVPAAERYLSRRHATNVSPPRVMKLSVTNAPAFPATVGAIAPQPQSGNAPESGWNFVDNVQLPGLEGVQIRAAAEQGIPGAAGFADSSRRRPFLRESQRLPNCGGCRKGPHDCKCLNEAGDPVPTGCKYTQNKEAGHESFMPQCKACADGWWNTAVF